MSVAALSGLRYALPHPCGRVSGMPFPRHYQRAYAAPLTAPAQSYRWRARQDPKNATREIGRDKGLEFAQNQARLCIRCIVLFPEENHHQPWVVCNVATNNT